MLAKIATVIAVLFAALTAPVIVSDADPTPAGYPAPAVELGAPPAPATATPYPLSDEPPLPLAYPDAQCVAIGSRPTSYGQHNYCAAWATPTLIYSQGYPAP